MKENRFLARGAVVPVREIQREMAQQVQPLQAKLKAETDGEKRAELKKRIKEIKKEYAQKEREANYSLFNQQR